MRKYYIDNLRLICILLLFPLHTLIAYNMIGVWNPVYIEPSEFATGFMLLFTEWAMPLLFVFAGMSAAYSLQKRSAREFLTERCSKILIPFVVGYFTVSLLMFVFGLMWTNPGMSFIQALELFFSPDAFYPFHLWFLMHLFIVSIAALPIVLRFMKTERFAKPREFSIWILIAFGLTLWLSSYVLKIGDKSVLMYFLLFLVGAVVMYADWVQDKLEKYRWPLFVAFIVMLAFFVYKIMYLIDTGEQPWFFDEWSGPLYDKMFMWIAILAMTGMGKRYLEFTNDRLKYFYTASFPIYIFHFIWIIVMQILITGVTTSMAVQVVFTIAASFVLTIGTYEVLRRWSVTRFLFGMSKSVPKKAEEKAK